ncbi:MAG: hypothetical protein E6I61_10395 [Chloroflexi bacterium]|nr:MAG: hypothetical protein E6J08_07290 [Chloroflexota bacterium]TME02002.1 MAG: hypothetical protein E6I71_14800 [Chloroflexota bacterium]TME40026.1 MAG: hypothetical protein E6I61_10395 [Chloroflexota bacterium]TME49770.1 MAG: hypothetical protein E6I53_14810 [Chloroflexota bacterium]TMG39087.1 MAG: hypothetical protein E6H92_04965 [Chloroflexota bacterium]
MDKLEGLEARTRLDSLEAPPEIRSLNAADLDVEELESRLEMAAAVPNSDCWANCGINIGL